MWPHDLEDTHTDTQTQTGKRKGAGSKGRQALGEWAETWRGGRGARIVGEAVGVPSKGTPSQPDHLVQAPTVGQLAGPEAGNLSQSLEGHIRDQKVPEGQGGASLGDPHPHPPAGTPVEGVLPFPANPLGQLWSPSAPLPSGPTPSLPSSTCPGPAPSFPLPLSVTNTSSSSNAPTYCLL